MHKIYFKHMLNLFLYLIANFYLRGALACWLGRLTLSESNFVRALEYSTNLISFLYRFSRVKRFKSLNLNAIKTALLVYMHSNIFDCK